MPSSALSNFVIAYSFGCSHPELTLHYQALLVDYKLQYMLATDAASLNLMLHHQFSLAISPTAWPEFRCFEDETMQSMEEWWQDWYVCPNQGWYFGGKGPMTRFLSPLKGDKDCCPKGNITPFSTMVIWQLMSTFECNDGWVSRWGTGHWCDIYSCIGEERPIWRSTWLHHW